MKILAQPGQLYRCPSRPEFHYLLVEEVQRSEGSPYILGHEVLRDGHKVYGRDRLGRDRSARILVHLARLPGGGIGLAPPYEPVPEVEQFTSNQPTEGDDMAKKKRTEKHVEEPTPKLEEATRQAVEAGIGQEVEPSEERATDAPEGEAQMLSRRPKKQAKAKEPKAATKRSEKKEPRAEREAVLDLEPAEDIKPARAGTQLADVLELTARTEGATAVELDEAIVTTAKSVKHYGIWALRYALHKNKGFGFRTVLKDGEPARYHLVLPKGKTLASFLTRSAGSTTTTSVPKSKPPVPKGRSAKKAGKAHGKKLAGARA